MSKRSYRTMQEAIDDVLRADPAHPVSTRVMVGQESVAVQAWGLRVKDLAIIEMAKAWRASEAGEEMSMRMDPHSLAQVALDDAEALMRVMNRED